MCVFRGQITTQKKKGYLKAILAATANLAEIVLHLLEIGPVVGRGCSRVLAGGCHECGPVAVMSAATTLRHFIESQRYDAQKLTKLF